MPFSNSSGGKNLVSFKTELDQYMKKNHMIRMRLNDPGGPFQSSIPNSNRVGVPLVKEDPAKRLMAQCIEYVYASASLRYLHAPKHGKYPLPPVVIKIVLLRQPRK